MVIHLNEKTTAVRPTGISAWSIVEDRSQLMEVPPSSVLREALDIVALYKEYFEIVESAFQGGGGARHADDMRLDEIVTQINAIHFGNHNRSEVLPL